MDRKLWIATTESGPFFKMMWDGTKLRKMTVRQGKHGLGTFLEDFGTIEKAKCFKCFKGDLNHYLLLLNPQGFGTLLHSKDMLDKSESFFGKKQKFKLEHKGKTVAVSVVDKNLAVEKSLLESGMDDIPRMIPSGNLT